MKLLLTLIVALLLITPCFSYDLKFNGVFYNRGVLDGPDSLRADVSFYPGPVDTTYRFTSLTPVWDTFFTRTDSYTEAFIVYKAWFGTDSVFGSETQKLQMDSINTAGYFAKVASTNWANATRTLTSFSGVGTEVWSNPIRSITDKGDFTLSSSEVTNIANNVKTIMETEGGMLWLMSYYLGAVDNGTVVCYPNSGISPKDSCVIYDNNGIAQAVVKYKHSNSAGVLDSIQYRRY